MMGSRVPIHVQAKMELDPTADPEQRDIMAPQARYNSYSTQKFTGTKVHGQDDSEQFRIRPQTPKLNMIDLRKKQNALKELKSRVPKLEKLNHVPTVKKQKITKVVKTKQPEPEKVMSQEDFLKMAQNGQPMPPPPDSSDESEEEEEEKVEQAEEIEEEELQLDRQDNQNVLFGEAYEQHFIDILENGDYDGELDISEKLLEITLGMSIDELKSLQKIQIQVDTTSSHLQQVGETLQSLIQLNLNDSIIHSIRDLGTSFTKIQVLQINRCELRDLSGFIVLDQLQELYASYNEISDIYDISHLQELEILDIEANQISDFNQINYLQKLPKLSNLDIDWNPIS